MREIQYIGIEIFDTIVRAAQISQGNRTAVAETPIPGGVVKNGRIADLDTMAHILLETLRNGKPEGLGSEGSIHVGMIVPKEYAYVASFAELQGSTSQTTAQAVAQVLANTVPLSPTEYEIAHRQRHDGVGTNILAVAVPKEIIRQYTEVAARAEVILRTITIEAEALYASLGDAHQSIAFIDIGLLNTHVHMYDEKGIVRTTFISTLGIQAMLDGISKKKQVSREEAQDLLYTNGFELDKDDDDLLFTLFSAFAPLIDDLKEGVADFKERAQYPLSQMYILGSGAAVPKIDEYIRYHVKTPTRLRRALTSNGGMEPQYDDFTRVSGVGLLMESEKAFVNFIETEAVKDQTVNKGWSTKQRLLLAGSILMVVAGASLILLYM